MGGQARIGQDQVAFGHVAAGREGAHIAVEVEGDRIEIRVDPFHHGAGAAGRTLGQPGQERAVGGLLGQGRKAGGHVIGYARLAG